jgi:polyferredoxin
MRESQRRYIRYLRYGVQGWFLGFCIFIGYRFYQFVLHFEAEGYPFVERPPSVEGFLPIAGFMSFKYFLFTGIVEPIHPAAMIMFVTIVGVSFLFKKGFCGWICPIGTLSQYLWMVGRRVFGRNLVIPKVMDIPLRSIKYLVMAFFLFVIGITISPSMMALFFISDYYKIVDIKTMKFFTEMSTTTAVFLLVTAMLSLVFKNFWCRYLCPYGALLGLVSLLSPTKIKRDPEECVGCGKCSKNCPSLIDVKRKVVVHSPECFGCLTCVSHCPSEALKASIWTLTKRRFLKPAVYIVSLLAVFYMVIVIGIVTDNWQSKLPYVEYKRILSKPLPEHYW